MRNFTKASVARESTSYILTNNIYFRLKLEELGKNIFKNINIP